MKIGILQFELRIPGARSLKDKRRVVKSVKDRLHREHMVSVAEVGANEVWNLALMGLACVSADGAYLHSVIDRVVAKLCALPEATLGEFSVEVLDADQLPTAFTDETGRPLWTEQDRREQPGEAA